MTILQSFQNVYHQLNHSNIALINTVYADDVLFVDPFHKINGLTQLRDYFSDLYQNIAEINFAFSHELSQSNTHYVSWVMSLQHPKLNKGRVFDVEGASRLITNDSGLINYHQDYFDAGAMLYERVPVIGFVVKKLKQQL